MDVDEINFEEEEYKRHKIKPLADFSVAIIGFDRNHAVPPAPPPSQCIPLELLIASRSGRERHLFASSLGQKRGTFGALESP
jgi:hypothetical protein